MAPVKRDKLDKAALPAKLTRSTKAISKTLHSGKTIETLVKSRTARAKPNSKMATRSESFAKMTENLQELGRKLGFS